jgi:nitrate reductase (cytochrome), electron transfer subunit
MSPRNRRSWALLLPAFLLASAMTATGALIIVARRAASNPRAAPASPRAVTVTGPDEPIAAEAQVFRTSAAVLAIAPTLGPRRSAHPRTLATYRGLRSYPGAPPRVPHGLTPNEFRTGGCNTCHERGGFSQRFGAYVPVTPHPEMGACLQCHVGNGQLMAIPLPSTDSSARCRQCHALGGSRWTDSTLNWVPMAWPQVARTSRQGEPPPIPHALEMRGNCLACHSAPSGVAEIRTSHPERADCRACHVAPDGDTDTYRRPLRDRAGDREGAP